MLFVVLDDTTNTAILLPFFAKRPLLYIPRLAPPKAKHLFSLCVLAPVMKPPACQPFGQGPGASREGLGF